jgi:hypothetical protein
LDVWSPPGTNAYNHDKAGRLTVQAQPSVDEQYVAAFRRWGLDVDGTAEAEVVRRLGAEPEPVVQELIAGLDSWMMDRWLQGRPEAEWRRLFRMAEQLDGCGRYWLANRRRVRRAWRGWWGLGRPGWRFGSWRVAMHGEG